MVGVTQWQLDPFQQVSKAGLTLGEWPFDEIFAVEVKEIEKKESSASALPVSDAAWIMLNEVVPSGRTPHSSPSKYACDAGMDLNASAIFGYLFVQLSPVRVSSRTSPPSSRACIRYPSNLISCNQSPAAGGSLTSFESCGFTKPGRMAFVERWWLDDRFRLPAWLRLSLRGGGFFEMLYLFDVLRRMH